VLNFRCNALFAAADNFTAVRFIPYGVMRRRATQWARHGLAELITEGHARSVYNTAFRPKRFAS
jgi:hypothetical protein